MLLQYEKAGSSDLKKYFGNEIKKNQIENKEIASKIKKNNLNLSDQEQVIYYIHWAYMAIHMAVSLPELCTVKSIQQHFSIDLNFCKNVIAFLIETKLIEKNGNKLSAGKTRIHLDRTSPLIKSLHQNSRQKAIDSLINSNDLNLHYSSVLVLSKDDAMRIKSLILELIKKKEEILLPSPDEDLVVFNIDYFRP